MATIDDLKALDNAQRELEEQRDRMNHALRMSEELKHINAQITELKGKEFTLKKMAEETGDSEVKKQQMLLEAAHAHESIIELESVQTALESKLKEFENNTTSKRFNKYLCFSNIRELLKNRDVKIGQIEKEAGCQPGYMSRLEKPNSTSEPSMEFLVTAAKMLNVSLEVLLFVDMTELTSTEKYLVSFLEKLQKDTIADKLEWNRESADSLNRLETDMNGYTGHPLFSYETFMEEGELEYPEQVERVTFVSNSFDCRTYIKGDCFNLKMKDGSVLYLMDISKSVYKLTDTDAYAKEIWMFTPGVGCHFIISNKDVPQLANLVNLLFETVNNCMKHPKIKKEVKFVIDAFLNGDLGQNDSELPFN